jgi:hypothetical protein
MAGKYRVDYLRNYCILKSKNARKEIFGALNFADEIVTEFVLDRAAG